MSDVAIQLDENNRDDLYARRVELFFSPREDGEPSTDGKVIWHTEWWHYSGELLRAKSIGPRIEKDVSELIDRSFDIGGDEPMSALAMIAGLKAAFVELAHEYLQPASPAQPEDPEE